MRTWAGAAIVALIFAVGGIRAVAGASAQGQSSGSVTQDQKDAAKQHG